MPPNTKTEEVNPTLNGITYEHIDLTALIEDQRIKTAENLKTSIETYQEEIIDRLLPAGWSRSGTYPKEFVTSIGRVTLTVIRMKRPPSKKGGTTSPILDVLSIRRKRYSDELRMLLASKASRMSYGDAQKDFQESSSLVVPKTTIHSFVQDVGSRLAEASTRAAVTAIANQKRRQMVEKELSRQQKRRICREESKKKSQAEASSVASWQQQQLIVVMGDGTKTQSVYPTLNNVNLAMTYDQETHSKQILGLGVNQSWKELGQMMQANGTLPPKETVVLVSDAEEEIPQYIDHSQVQLDRVHAVKDSLFRMWMDNSTREEREKLSEEMDRILSTLVNSTKKHLKDSNKKRLSKRIKNTLSELENIASRLEKKGYQKTSQFIRKHAVQMVTFAKIALTSNVRIPHTSNAIERLMGEISKRCKHKWAHWSTTGLENMLWIVLVRYTNPRLFKAFWNRYIHPISHQVGRTATTSRIS